MEVTLKYELINRHTINSISYNGRYNILGITGNGNDTASFFAVEGVHANKNDNHSSNNHESIKCKEEEIKLTSIL